MCLVVSLPLFLSVAPASAHAACTRFASTSGSDSGSGSVKRPYRTAQKLVDSLSAGQAGCLRAGTYMGNVTISRSGAEGAPITVTSYPGEQATISGKLWISDSANFVTVASLNLDGRNSLNLPSPAVDGDDARFVNDDVTNYNTAICFDLGAAIYGRAYRTVIQGNRIHNCGALPPTNFEHGIYAEQATSATIVDNLIYDNADRGIQVYPDAQASYIARNVIDGNGEGVLIAGGSEDYGPQASNNNVIEQNVITNSQVRNNVESYWGSSLVGQRNVVRDNCIWGGARDAVNHGLASQNGFTAYDNTFADPLYVNRDAKDFRLSESSPCLSFKPVPTPGSGDGATEGGGSQASTGTIVLSSKTHALRPGKRVVLTGRVIGAPHPERVSLQYRWRKRWRSVAKVRIAGDGRFSAGLLLRHATTAGKGSRQPGLRLAGARLSSATRALTLSASTPGFRRSNTARVRIRRHSRPH
jgi:hypothetical protein